MIRLAHRAVLIVLLASMAAAVFPASAAAQSSNVVVVNVETANIRSGPSANTTILGAVSGGTELPVTGRNAGSTWWRVNAPVGTGWISNEVVLFRGSVGSVPVVTEPAGILEPPRVIVDGYAATVYRNPNSDSFVIGLAPTGAILVVTGRSYDGNWWQVATPMGTGYINIAQVAFRGDDSLVPRVADPGPSFEGPTIRVNSDVTITTEPGGGTVIGTLPAGTALPASGRNADNTWWQVAGIFGIGWIPVSDVSLANAASSIHVTSDFAVTGPVYTGAALATVTIEADRKVAYKGGTFNSPAMWDARRGEQGGVVARSPDGLWLEVTMKGYIGWMNFSGITLQGTMADIPVVDTSTPIVNVAIVNIHMLNIRSGPGVQYTSIATVQGGTTLTVTGRHPTLPWLRVEGSYGVGWVRIMYIIFRGVWAVVPAVTEPAGTIQLPIALTESSLAVYSQHDLASPAGTVPPGSYTIIGRTSSFEWVLIQTPQGSLWALSSQIILRGVADVIPVVP